MALYKTDFHEQDCCYRKIKKSISALQKKNNGIGFMIRNLFINLYTWSFILSVAGCLFAGIFTTLALAFDWNLKAAAAGGITMMVCIYIIIANSIILVISLFSHKYATENSRIPHAQAMMYAATFRENEYIEISDDGINIKYLESRRRTGRIRRRGSSPHPDYYRKIELNKNSIFGIIHSSDLGLYILPGNLKEYTVKSNAYAEYSYVNMQWEPAEPVNGKCIIILDTCENTETGMKDIGNMLYSHFGITPKELDYEKTVDFIWNTNNNFSAYMSVHKNNSEEI